MNYNDEIKNIMAKADELLKHAATNTWPKEIKVGAKNEVWLITYGTFIKIINNQTCKRLSSTREKGSLYIRENVLVNSFGLTFLTSELSLEKEIDLVTIRNLIR